MTSTSHALVAGALAKSVPDPLLAFILSYATHFMLDSIPHWDFGTNWRSRPKRMTATYAIAETIFGIIVSYIFFGRFLPFFHWALTVSASLLPDWLETPWYIFYAHQNKIEPDKHAGIVEKIAYGFYKIPNMFHAKAQLPIGIYTQIAAVVFFIFLLG